MAAPIVPSVAAPSSQHDALNRICVALENATGPFSRTHLTAATTAVANRLVASTNMVNGAYTVANGGTMPGEGARKVTVTHTAVSTVDTLGVITVTGTDLRGAAISEQVTPANGTVATGTLWFRTVTSVVGSGWTAAAGADTIVVGVAAGVIAVEGSGSLHSVVVSTTAAGTVTLSDADGVIAILKSSIAEGTYVFDVAFSGYLGVALTAASDVTIVRTAQP